MSVIVRFLGATPSSNDIRRPLISIIEQISAIYHFPPPSNLDHPTATLENLLMKTPKTQHLVLLLDSIDQLQLADIQDLSLWLPRKFPSTNVKCILSTIAEIELDRKEIHLHGQFQSVYGKSLIEVTVPPLGQQIAHQVLASWLKHDRRRLTDLQLEWLKPKFAIAHHITPLFLSLLYDQTTAWHSYDGKADPKFLAIKQTRDAIGYLYHQLGTKHGQILFRRAMRYLQLSGGLNEVEMEDVLSLDDDVLQSVFVHYLPPWKCFRLPSTLWIRIRNDMHKYLVEKEIDSIPCICL